MSDDFDWEGFPLANPKSRTSGGGGVLLCPISKSEVTYEGRPGAAEAAWREHEATLSSKDSHASLLRELGEKRVQALSLLTLNKAQLQTPGVQAQKASEDAKQSASTALSIFRELKDPRGEGLALHGQAAALALGGAIDAAVRTAREALALFQEMQSRGRLKPDTITFNALICACAKGEAWVLALERLLQAQMVASADVITHNAAMDAYGRVGRWAGALPLSMTRLKPSMALSSTSTSRRMALNT